MDEINFAAQCLLEMSHSKDHINRPLDLSNRPVVSKDVRSFLPGNNNPGPAVIVEPVPVVPHSFIKEEPVTTNSTESSSYMVARILTDLTRIKQEVPEVPSDSEGNLTIDEDEQDEGYSSYINNSKGKSRNSKVCEVVSGIAKNIKAAMPFSRKPAVPRAQPPNKLTTQLRKTHKCLYDGCHKVYGKSSHLKAHLRTHTDLWQGFVTEKIWTKTRLKCGYSFKYHYLNKEVTSGHFVGACNCGSKIKCEIDRTADNVVVMACSTTKGSNECGKRYVRGVLRNALGEKLQLKSAHVFRTNMADDLMDEGDPEPPHLPKTRTLRQIKHQIAARKFLNPNPILGLEILRTYSMEGEITWIGHMPFFVHYSTKLQRNVYEIVRKTEHLCVAIDSTGSIIQSISRVNKKKSGPIFLYLAVVSTNSGQLPVAQMLTERHTTGAVHFWLSQWIEQWGLSLPTEIVCDQSVALLSGAVRAFTSEKTINKYADAFFSYNIPPCYIRIDIAHYIKTWTVFLKDVRFEVGKFLKAGIGKIILSRSLDVARKIIAALLTITISKKCGKTVDNNLSACEKAKAFLKHFLETAEMSEFMDQFNDLDSSEDDTTDNTAEKIETRQTSGAEPSLWRNWASDIASSVKDELDAAPGTDINPYWVPKFADRLVAEIKWLPLWSCVFRDKYGFGRCPASSAHVEAEFGTIKQQLFHQLNTPLRADEFVRIHKKYLDGTLKTISASVNSNIITESERSETESSKAEVDNCPDVNLCHDVSDIVNITENSDEQSSVVVDHTSCPACKNGDMPGGAHNCMICARAVHAIEPCSVAASESDEGFGQRRICTACIAKPNAPQLMESRAYENWRDQVVAHEKKQAREKNTQKKKRHGSNLQKKKQAQDKNSPGNKQARGKYLQETYPVNEFLLTDALATIPILKSGSETKLKPIRQGESQIDLIRTCSFDSLFQLILTVAYDSRYFLENVIQTNKTKNLFCQLIDNTRVKSITMATYRARAKILSELFEKTGHKEFNCFIIKCECTVASMARKVLKNVPCFIEKSTCNAEFAQCLPMTKKFPILAVSLQALLSDDYNETIYEEIIMKSRSCSTEGCTGTVISELKSLGSFILLEVIGDEYSDDVKLDDIPKKLKLPNMAKEMDLRGIVHFEPPPRIRGLRNAQSEEGIGHYTAFCLRNTHWSEYRKQLMTRSRMVKVFPQLILYTPGTIEESRRK